MYKLYTSAGSCSMAVHTILNELNVPFEPVLVSTATDTKTPEYLKLNPRGQVPLLILNDGTPMVEGGAQVVYLLDAHDDGRLLPKSGTERAVALQWLMFANASLHPAYSKWFWAKKTNVPAEWVKMAEDSIQSMWDQIEARLEQTKNYLAGENPTAGDILITVFANWAGGGANIGTGGLHFGPNTRALFKRITERPAFAKAMQTEDVTYKAAA